jgi:hypothetical protein
MRSIEIWGKKRTVKDKKSKKKVFEDFRYCQFYPTVLKIEDKVIVLRNGIAFRNLKSFLFTSYRYFKTTVTSFLISILSMARRGIVSVDSGTDKYGIIHSCWTTGYYHWVTEALPRAIVLNKVAPTVVPYLPYPSPTYQEESLKALGFAKIEYFPTKKNVMLDKVYLTECPGAFATMHTELINKVRITIYKNLAITSLSPTKIIYVSRKNARGRGVLNEAELVNAITALGGEVAYFETMSFQEQVLLMSECKVLLGNHGAGLANMIFMKPGGLVVELLPHRNGLFDYRPIGNSFRHQAIYWRLANACNHKHEYQLCDHDLAFYKSTDLANIYVDVEKLARIIVSSPSL